MRRILATVLALFLCLGLTACTPVAEVTASPEPTETGTPRPSLRPGPRPTFAPVPKSTPTPMPTPTPTPTEPAHEWSGYGYSYTSKALGIRIEFPQTWMEYFDIVEEEHVRDGMVDQDGNPVEPYTATSLYLYPKGFTLEIEDADGNWVPMHLASIGFTPKGESSIYDGDDSSRCTLLETEEGSYVCGMWRMLGLWYEPGISADGAKYAIINEVQGGIMDGRWEIEVLEK